MRLAVIGLGFMGSTHVKAALALPNVELAAVCSRDEKKLGGDFSDIKGNLEGLGGSVDLSGVTKYRDIAALLADPAIEAVDICLPTGMHEKVAIDALRAGKHVLVEKPMALDGAACDRMVAEADRHKRVLMSAQVIRFWPEFAALRETLRSGRLGRLRTALFRRRCAAPSWGVWETSGAFDLLIHDVDYTIHLLGMPESISATGVADDEAGIDILHAHFFYRDGAEALVTGGWHNKGEYPFSMEFTATFDRDTVEYDPAAGRGVTKGEADNPYAEEIGWFARCCAGEPNHLCPPQQSADAVKLTLFALEARKRKGERIACTI